MQEQIEEMEMQIGKAEGTDGTEMGLQNILRDLATLYLKISNLEDRVDELEANQAWKGPLG